MCLTIAVAVLLPGGNGFIDNELEVGKGSRIATVHAPHAVAATADAIRNVGHELVALFGKLRAVVMRLAGFSVEVAGLLDGRAKRVPINVPQRRILAQVFMLGLEFTGQRENLGVLRGN